MKEIGGPASGCASLRPFPYGASCVAKGSRVDGKTRLSDIQFPEDS